MRQPLRFKPYFEGMRRDEAGKRMGLPVPLQMLQLHCHVYMVPVLHLLCDRTIKPLAWPQGTVHPNRPILVIREWRHCIEWMVRLPTAYFPPHNLSLRDCLEAIPCKRIGRSSASNYDHAVTTAGSSPLRGRPYTWCASGVREDFEENPLPQPQQQLLLQSDSEGGFH